MEPTEPSNNANQTPAAQAPQPAYTPSSSAPAGAEGGSSFFSKWKLPLIAGAAVLLVGGSVGAYYGYYMNSGVVWKQALEHTSRGYDSLVNYSQDQAKTKYKGVKFDGSFKVTAKDFAGDGSFKGVSEGANSSSELDFGASGIRIKGQLRTIKAANSENPDVYVQVSGIKGLGAMVDPAYANMANSLDGQWLAVDHTLLDQLESQASPDKAKAKELTSEDVIDGAKALGKANRDYLFTTNKDKAVFSKAEKIGTETRDGRKTLHYKVTVDKNHVHAYLKAADSALEQSKLGKWMKDTTGQSIKIDELWSGMDKTKIEPLDVWVDTDTRTIHTLRIHEADKPKNYLDLGLNYTGGSKYPFTIGSHAADGQTTDTLAATITLDTKANTVAMKATMEEKGGDNAFQAQLSANISPNNEAVKVTAPSGAKSLLETFTGLGLGALPTGASSAAPSAAELESLGANSGLTPEQLQALLQQ